MSSTDKMQGAQENTSLGKMQGGQEYTSLDEMREHKILPA
jgi:hypothetical protein